ncbi:MAG: Ig-like domain-containing protein [Candidatus Paceibacterota bacterium]|jgi:hypothetical protein
MSHTIRTFWMTAIGVVCFVVPASASAATMFLVPQQSVVGPKDTVIVDVRIDSAGTGFNAAQATLHFPKNLLLAGEAETKGSAFSFWLEQPSVSNDRGTVSFIGGAPYGVSGSSIQVLRLVFTPRGTGSGIISIVDAAVTSSDGSGANILATTTDTTITVSPTRVSPPAVTTITTVATSTTVARTPVAGTAVPSAPAIRVPLYPEDGTAWYNTISKFSVSWALAPDVSGVSTAVNRESVFTPPAESEGLFDNETFDALSDGVWYVHVRFQNNLGWGKALHRRIAIDTVPPAGFKVAQVSEKDPTTPKATLEFRASDALSGIRGYQVSIDGTSLPTVSAAGFTGAFTTPLLAPGEHAVSVQATDLAGNSVISTSTVRIEPIPSPIITSATEHLYVGDNRGLMLYGSAPAQGTLLFSILKDGVVTETGSAVAGSDGNWIFTSEHSLPAGTFVVQVRNQDARGALSDVVVSPQILVEEKPVIQFGIFRLNMEGAIILLLVILFGGVAGGWWLYRKRQELLFMRLISTEADMAKVFTMIRTDLAQLRAPSGTDADRALTISRLDENIEKMQEYLRHEMQNINK